MANISISQMDTRAVANLSDLFEVAYADEQSSTGYGSGKMSAEVIANGIVNSYTYTSAMPNMGNRTLAGAMNTMLEGFAPAYDDTQTYAVGDYCTYAGKMYICTTAVSTAGAWDSTKWTETTCAEEFGNDVEVDSALSTTSENPVQNKVITQNINSINANLVSTQTTAKADIVSITDAQDIPAEDVKADIEPIQDLHGYEYPWVGGAGVNKWDEEWELGGINSASGEKNNNVTNRIRSKNYIPINANTNIYVKNGGSGDIYVFVYDENKAYTGNYYNITNTSLMVTSVNGYIMFSPTSDYGTTYNNDICINVSNSTINGNYYPYSNICPISGYTECEVTRTGKNLANPTLNGYYDMSGFVSSNNWTACELIKCLPNTEYTLSNASGNIGGNIFFYDSDGTYVEYIATGSTGTNTFTTPQSAHLIGIYGRTFDNAQLELGNQATSYQPYQGQTYTVSFNDTVYSGTLDVTTGVLTVDKAMVDLGSLTWEYDSTTPRFITNGISSIVQRPANNDTPFNALCEQYRVIAISELTSSQADALIGVASTTGALSVKDTRYTDATAFKTAMDGVQLIYELATPQVYSLTPTQIDMLLNNNVISADTGKIQVKYQPDNVIGELKKLIYQLTNQ